MAEYIVHKAVELAKVKSARRAVLREPGYLEANYIAQAKFDGCNMVALFDGENVKFMSRTGEEVTSVDHIGMALRTFPGLLPGAYLGECWCPDLPFNEISGLFRRQETSEETARLQFAIFDYLTPLEWEEGHSSVEYGNRVARLPEGLGLIPQGRAPIWSAGSFGHITETFPNTTAQDVCDKLVEAGGYDGLILRDPYGTWTKGSSGTGGEIIKIKRKLSFDLKVTGMEEGKGKHAGKMGALLLDFKGKVLRVGTGFSDAEREVWWEWRNDPMGFYNVIGKIGEVEAMDFSSDGLLREPRWKGLRHDKTEPDA